MRYRAATVVGIASAMGFAHPGLAKEKQVVTVSYLVGPARPLPEGLRAVAVINSGVSAAGIKQDEREGKWSIMAADMIEAMLQAGSALSHPPLAVAKRSETQAVLREHDLALAGMVGGDQAAAAGKLLSVQGLITSRIIVNIDEQRGTRSTIDWMSIMGGAMRGVVQGQPEPAPVAPAPAPGPVVVERRPHTEVRRGPDGRTYIVQRQPPPVVIYPRYRRSPALLYDPRLRAVPRQERSVAGGGLMLQTRDVEEVSRHLTVQCSFTLIDVATGQALLQYSPPPSQKRDRKSPDFWFGGLVGEKELDPVDHFIGELVEQSTREFVSMLVPVRVSYEYELVGKHSAAEQGIRLLRGDDYAGAMSAFERDLKKHPDEHETLFAMGVVSELMGLPDQALQFYRQALASEDVEHDDDEVVIYSAAKDRLTAHAGRILPPLPPGPPPGPPGPGAGAGRPPGPPVPAPVQTTPAAQAPAGQPGEPPPPIVEESIIEQPR
ncbi:MAG: hypothetical protein HY718_01880 [Planctomycetes bacterium]|nr:hypothetical protein [Planctomycetota bacterium]